MELHTVYWCLPCGGCTPKGVPVPAGSDTQEKSAVRESLIRWKTVRFSIEDRVIAHSVFCVGSLRQRKFRKIFDSRKTALEKFLRQRFVHVHPFRIVVYIDGRKQTNLSASKKNIHQ